MRWSFSCSVHDQCYLSSAGWHKWVRYTPSVGSWCVVHFLSLNLLTCSWQIWNMSCVFSSCNVWMFTVWWTLMTSSAWVDDMMIVWFVCVWQIKSCKCETEIQALTLKSLLYLERYMYLILFNTYLHLEKRDSWQRSFSDWMIQVTSHTHKYKSQWFSGTFMCLLWSVCLFSWYSLTCVCGLWPA